MIQPRVCAALCAAVALTAANPAWSQASYPERTVRLVVGFPPGGGADSIARVYAERLSRELGQQVIIDNKPGGGTTIASDFVARARPDGYTILLATSGITGSDQVIYPTVRYQPDDFVPIIKLTDSPLILAVSQDAGISSVPELIDHAKANPGALNFAHSGAGVITHLAGVQFAQLADIALTEVPYRGGAQAAVAVAAGEADLIFATVPSIQPMIAGDRVVPLAVSSKAPSEAFPQLPTVSETVEGFDATIWFGIFAPKGVSDDVQAKLFAASAKVMQDPGVLQGLKNVGEVAAPSTSQDEFKQFVQAQGATSTQLAKLATEKAP